MWSSRLLLFFFCVHSLDSGTVVHFVCCRQGQHRHIAAAAAGRYRNRIVNVNRYKLN